MLSNSFFFLVDCLCGDRSWYNLSKLGTLMCHFLAIETDYLVYTEVKPFETRHHGLMESLSLRRREIRGAR